MPARTDILKAAKVMSLGDAGYPPKQAGEIVGLGKSTAREIMMRHGSWGEIAERPLFARLRQEQSTILEAQARSIAAQALVQCEETLPNANAYQACLIASILVDKSRLLAGESTENISVHTQVEFSGLDQLAEVLSRRLVSCSTEQNVTEAVIVQPVTDLRNEGGTKPAMAPKRQRAKRAK